MLKFTWKWLPGRTHAHLWDNPIPDALRILCAVLGVILACYIVRVLLEGRRRVEPMARTQRARFWALMLADLSITATELTVLGTVMTPRLVINVACLALGGWGVRGIRVKQRTRQPIAPRSQHDQF